MWLDIAARFEWREVGGILPWFPLSRASSRSSDADGIVCRRSCGYRSDIMAITVGSRELKNRLGSYLRQVGSGATIVVTDRGTPVAELRSVQPAGAEEQERLDALVASGLLAPRTRTRLAKRDPSSVKNVALTAALSRVSGRHPTRRT